MPVFRYDLVDLGKWLIGRPEVLKRERSKVDAASPKFWFDEAAPLTFDRSDGSLSVRLEIPEAPIRVESIEMSREEMTRAGEALLSTLALFRDYRKALFDVALDDERVTLILMDESFEEAQARISREEAGPSLVRRLGARLKRER